MASFETRTVLRIRHCGLEFIEICTVLLFYVEEVKRNANIGEIMVEKRFYLLEAVGHRQHAHAHNAVDDVEDLINNFLLKFNQFQYLDHDSPSSFFPRSVFLKQINQILALCKV